MRFKSTYLALALLAGFGLALGACSSGGDDAPAPPAVDMDALNAQKTAAAAAATAAAAAVSAVEAINAADMASYDAAVAASAAAAAASAKAAAAETVADATKYADMAKAANANAMKYAGMVQAAEDKRIADAAAAAEAQALADAQAAARTAWQAARDALAGIAGQESADPASYQRAMNALADAKAAYDAAKAATTSSDAEGHQDDAEAASQMAISHADAVAAAYIAMRDAPAIAAARTSAMTAAEMANAAYMAAKAAVDGVMSISADDMASYDAAVAQVAAAKTAADAAQAASDAAGAATLLGDAEAQRDAAQAALADANTANTEAMKYAGMVQTAYDTRVGNEAEAERMALAAAKTDAMSAYDTAKAAYDAAKARVDALTATDVDDHVRASDALMRAKTAYDAAMAANDMAQAATTSADAQGHQADVEAARDTVVAEVAGVNMYAALVEAVQNDRAGEAQRMMDVASARSAAMQSYMDADADAMKAEQAAADAEAAAPGSAGAVAARAAATAARTAANMAKAAHDAIMDDMTKAEADAQATAAATQAGNANSSYMTAKAENDTIQTIVSTQMEQQRKDDAAAANTAVSAAMMASEAADTHADNAEQARDDAQAAYMMAMDARTDSAAAKMHYEAAKMAAMRARTAADAAEAAYMAAKMAAEGDVSTPELAKAARSTAETEQGKAEMQRDMAMAYYDSDVEDAMGAMQLAAMAEEAAGEHVLQLFLAANGAHVPDLESTMTIDENAVHVARVGAAMAAIAAVTDGNQTAGTTVTITHPGDTVDDPGTDADEFAEGMRTITVNVAGTTAIVAEMRESRAATDLNNDGDTTDDGEAQIIQTARMIDNLGVFSGYELWENDDDDATNTDRARAILFTNKVKGDDSVLAVTAAAARSVVGQTVAAEELAKVTSTGTTITGVEWTPSGETALTGTLTCGDACSITLGADGAVTAISGYTFTGSRAAVEAVTAADAMEDNDYLAFGLWLEESDDGATDTFGSFAVGGTGYAVNVQNAVTGTANYSGVAAGAHHKTGEGVNWFHGDAMLTANFGAIDTDAERGTNPPVDTSAGTISGEISNIRVGGGDPLSDSIVLRQADLTDGTATFNGNARMGAGEIQDDDTVEYPYNGTWSGSFFGATADDTETTDVNESITAPLAAAGTFGVTMTEGTGDDMVVESFVGAFGAHKQ